MPAARSGARRREAERERRPRREPPPKRERRRSDLASRVLVAIPLAIATIIFIGLGGLAFQLFLIAAGLICMHECYRLLGAWRPVPLIGFAALAAMVFAARSGGQGGVLEVAVAAPDQVVNAIDGQERRMAGQPLLCRAGSHQGEV